MKPYDSYPDVPIWLSALNGQLLTTTELDILNFVFWCNRFGCRTSNDRIGMHTHHSHATVQRAVMKLYSLDLIAIENFGKRTRALKPVKWPDQNAWLRYKKTQASIEADAAHHAPHIPPIDKPPPTGVAMGGCSESTFQVDSFSPGGGCPQPPARCSVRGGDEAYRNAALEMYYKLLSIGWSDQQARQLTRRRYSLAIIKAIE